MFGFDVRSLPILSVLQGKTFMGTELKNSLFALSEVYWAAGEDTKYLLFTLISDIFVSYLVSGRYTILEAVGSEASTKLTVGVENVAGVQIPVFDQKTKERDGILLCFCTD